MKECDFMATTATTLRLDSALKKRVEAKLKATGLTLNSYLVLATQQFDLQGKIPFEIKTPSEEPTDETKKAILQAESEENGLSKSRTPGFTDNQELMSYMKKRAKKLQ